MSFKISIGLVASLLVVSGLFALNAQSVFAAGSVFIGTCGNCGYGPIGAKIASQLSAAGIPATSGPFANGSQASNLYADIPGKGTVKLEDYFRTNNPAEGAKIELGNQAGIDAATKAISDKVKPLQDECIFMEGGNVEEQFTPPGGTKTAGNPTGYGKYDPTDPGNFETNSPQNLALFYGGENTYQTRFDEVSAQAKADMAKNPGKKITIYLPNAEQSISAMNTGKYTVNGVPVSGKYVVGVTGTDGVTVDENCNPTKGAAPKDPFSGLKGNQGGLGGSPGSGLGGGLGGALGGAGGLAALLPLLMQGLLGGGQGNQGNLGGQSGAGAGNGNVAIPCSAYGTSPVCGADGQTYTNSCYMQQYGVTQVGSGVCGSAGSSSSSNLSNIITQLAASGVPQSLIDSIVSAFNTIPLTPNSQVTIP